MVRYYESAEPLFEWIEKALVVMEHLVIAIDGGAASGKTTLADTLAQRFDGAVVHMDDFFLRPEQRTSERLAEPGGNFDRERFHKEVFSRLEDPNGFSYQRFDCSRMSLGEFVHIPKKRLLIIEGSYSHHPSFRTSFDVIDLKIFLETDKEIRKARILKRNGEEKYKEFFTRWIPLEDRYFEFFSIRDHADIVIKG